ncbi:hypothetical protein N431DRAFT_398426 [Stipitochalara longipes BDJ]|nr:hypothetical protein N431DRAFT_398426 [Stipitochalara longipes BDJ]
MKCDETSPNPCQRCLKSGVTCVYRPESDLVFRDMTSISETKVRRRVKARIAAREGSAGPSNSSSPVGSVISTPQCTTHHPGDGQPSICPPISTVWRDVAIPRFFADYVFESKLFTGSSLSFLPELYGCANMHTPLKEALNAVAWLSMSNQLGIKSLKSEACRSYFHAIELMAKLLQGPGEARQDATLATNYLFGLFETKYLLISGFKLSGVAFSRYGHHSGRVTLLELRGREQFTTQLGINIFRTCYAHIVIKCITEHVNPTEEVNLWLEAIPRDDPGLSVSKCNLRTARLCHDAQVLFDNNSEDEWWILKMLGVVKEAVLIDLQYQQWADSLPTPWRPRIIRKPGKTSMDRANAEATSIGLPQYVYEDVYVAWASNNCRAARIHLHEVLLHCVSLIELHPHAGASSYIEETRIKSRTIISDMVSDICASTDFCLGDINSGGDPAPNEYRMPLCGYLMIWILWRTYVSAPKESAYRLWLGSKLEFISNFMGVVAARAVIDRTLEDPWDMRYTRFRC